MSIRESGDNPVFSRVRAGASAAADARAASFARVSTDTTHYHGNTVVYDAMVPTRTNEHGERWCSMCGERILVNTEDTPVTNPIVQGQDGTPYLCYFDKPRNLAFVWDGTYGTRISVHFDGHSEPESDHFEWGNEFPDEHVVDTLRRFQSACLAYIERTYGRQAVRDAFDAGYSDVIDNEGYLNLKDESPVRQAFVAGRNIRSNAGLDEL